MSDASGIYDDGATYGPDPNAQTVDTSIDPIYDDGEVYGNGKATEQ